MDDKELKKWREVTEEFERKMNERRPDLIWNDWKSTGWRIPNEKPKPTMISAEEILEGYNDRTRQRKVLVSKVELAPVGVDAQVAPEHGDG